MQGRHGAWKPRSWCAREAGGGPCTLGASDRCSLPHFPGAAALHWHLLGWGVGGCPGAPSPGPQSCGHAEPSERTCPSFPGCPGSPHPAESVPPCLYVLQARPQRCCSGLWLSVCVLQGVGGGASAVWISRSPPPQGVSAAKNLGSARPCSWGRQVDG